MPSPATAPPATFGRAPLLGVFRVAVSVPVGLRCRQQHAASSVVPGASLGGVGWCGWLLALHAFERIDEVAFWVSRLRS